MMRRFAYFGAATNAVVWDTLILNFAAYEVRDSCLYYWRWSSGYSPGDTAAYRMIDAPLDIGKEWDRCLPNKYAYVSDPAETLRTGVSDELVHVRYRGPVSMPAGTFQRVYEIWYSELGEWRWCAFAPGVGPVSFDGGDLIDYYVAK